MKIKKVKKIKPKKQKPILYEKRRVSLTPAVIVLNVLLIAIVIMICVLVYTYMKTPEESGIPTATVTEKSETSENSPTMVADPKTSRNTETAAASETPPMTKATY